MRHQVNVLIVVACLLGGGCSIARVEAPAAWAVDEREDWKLLVGGSPNSSILSLSLVNNTGGEMAVYGPEHDPFVLECVVSMPLGGFEGERVKSPPQQIPAGSSSAATLDIFPEGGGETSKREPTPAGDYACRMYYDDTRVSYFGSKDAADDDKPKVGRVYSAPFMVKVRGNEVTGVIIGK